MKKLILLSTLLIFACSSDLFAQDYMNLRKKQLRIEHQKKLDELNKNIYAKDLLKAKVDSLNRKVLFLEQVEKLRQVDIQLAIESSNSMKNENDELKSNLELLNSKISLLNQELTTEKDISQKLRDLATIRDFSDGTFNDDELAFITNYFKIELKSNVYNEEERESKAFIDSTEIQVSLEGEGYGPAFNFKRNYNTSLAGDLDKDGTYEIIFNVEETGGGNAVWFNYYCLKIFNGNPYEMFQIEFPCPCKESEDCGDTRGWIVDVSGDILTISSSCFLEDDANCCPSSDATSKYKFDGKPRLSMQKNDTQKNNSAEDLCSLVDMQIQILNDAKEAVRLFRDYRSKNSREKISQIKIELDRLETESDKYFETRDGRTEADVESNIKIMKSCDSYNVVFDLYENGGADDMNFINNFDE